jgi:hypothetical protein
MLLTRQRLANAGLPVPWFREIDIADDPRSLIADCSSRVVVKPIG